MDGWSTLVSCVRHPSRGDEIQLVKQEFGGRDLQPDIVNVWAITHAGFGGE